MLALSPTHSTAVSPDMWIYLLGEATEGKTVKIGKTSAATMAVRIESIDRDQHSAERYVLLAAMRGESRAEKATQDYFDEYRLTNRGSHREYFRAESPLVEYMLWLRAQYCVSIDPVDTEELIPAEDINFWLPRPERRMTAPPDDPDTLFSRHVQLQGTLAGTAWNWVPDPMASFQDYFTPPDIVRRAGEAMGGIDLDPASHFLANKRLILAGVHIGRYFTRAHSAFDNDWNGRIWLNPPYGDYLPWFERIAEQMRIGHVQQVCMISPMWAFGTKQARPHMARATAMIVLSPTPEFFNPGDPTKTGRNDPHGVVYWGDRRSDFLDAFGDIGIPCTLEPR